MIVPERRPRESARDYAMRVLRKNIVNMELEPGCMVSENELSTEMGLSRTPVREALIELSKSGIVEIFPQHGSMVSYIDYAKIEEASFTRRVLETAIIQDVCDLATEEDIRDLDENLSLQEVFFAREDYPRLLEFDNRFHRQLFRICKKNLSYELVRSLSAHLDRVRRLTVVTVRELRIVDDHRRILKAITERDKEMARDAMIFHLNRYTLDLAEIREKYGKYMVP